MAKILSLPKEIQIIAVNELNEIPERVEEDIAFIRRWVLQQAHLNARTDDHLLLSFLRRCKFSLEKTKKRLELFYTVKTALPDIFKNRDPLLPKMQLFFQQNLFCILPKTLNGPVLILIRFENVNPNIISLTDFLKMGTITFDVILQDIVGSAVVGQAIVMDLKNLSAEFLLHLTPRFIKQSLTCLKDAYPSRLKALSFINFPSILFPAFNFLKSLLPKKLKDRVTCDTSDGGNTIRKYFPLSVLPTEYGGTAGPMADMCENTRIKILNYRDWLLEDELYGCIEERRPASSKLEIDLSSIDGSFRKLEVD